MKNAQYEELAGRIEGVAVSLLALTSALEEKTLIDGDYLSRRWRQAGQDRRVPGRPVCTQAAQQMLVELAAQIDAIRAARQSQDLLN